MGNEEEKGIGSEEKSNRFGVIHRILGAFSSPFQKKSWISLINS